MFGFCCVSAYRDPEYGTPLKLRVKILLMGPKLVQDVAPPKTPGAAAPELPSGPELVNDIPVRAQANPASQLGNQNGTQSASLPPAADKKSAQGPNPAAKSKPTAAILFALLAVISLAAGAYLQFLANR